jgi:hypothetical protein
MSRLGAVAYQLFISNLHLIIFLKVAAYTELTFSEIRIFFGIGLTDKSLLRGLFILITSLSFLVWMFLLPSLQICLALGLLFEVSRKQLQFCVLHPLS